MTHQQQRVFVGRLLEEHAFYEQLLDINSMAASEIAMVGQFES
jgi:hypothetical protein